MRAEAVGKAVRDGSDAGKVGIDVGGRDLGEVGPVGTAQAFGAKSQGLFSRESREIHRFPAARIPVLFLQQSARGESGLAGE